MAGAACHSPQTMGSSPPSAVVQSTAWLHPVDGGQYHVSLASSMPRLNNEMPTADLFPRLAPLRTQPRDHVQLHHGRLHRPCVSDLIGPRMSARLEGVTVEGTSAPDSVKAGIDVIAPRPFESQVENAEVSTPSGTYRLLTVASHLAPSAFAASFC